MYNWCYWISREVIVPADVLASRSFFCAGAPHHVECHLDLRENMVPFVDWEVGIRGQSQILQCSDVVHSWDVGISSGDVSVRDTRTTSGSRRVVWWLCGTGQRRNARLPLSLPPPPGQFNLRYDPVHAHHPLIPTLSCLLPP